MLSENSVFGFVDAGGQGSRPAPVGMDLLHQPAVRFADFRLAGKRLKPQDFVGFLRVHAARTRRRTMPVRIVALDVFSPSGMRAVEITFQEP